MTKFRKISSLTAFNNEFKKLHKKYRTLQDDLKILVETQLYLYHKLKIDNGGIEEIRRIQAGNFSVYKVTKFACRSLRGKGVKSGIRIIYAYFEKEEEIELIEIYYKGDKAREDSARITTYCADKLRQQNKAPD